MKTDLYSCFRCGHKRKNGDVPCHFCGSHIIQDVVYKSHKDWKSTAILVLVMVYAFGMLAAQTVFMVWGAHWFFRHLMSWINN